MATSTEYGDSARLPGWACATEPNSAPPVVCRALTTVGTAAASPSTRGTSAATRSTPLTSCELPPASPQDANAPPPATASTERDISLSTSRRCIMLL